jgi:hypothetical protein
MIEIAMDHQLQDPNLKVDSLYAAKQNKFANFVFLVEMVSMKRLGICPKIKNGEISLLIEENNVKEIMDTTVMVVKME